MSRALYLAFPLLLAGCVAAPTAVEQASVAPDEDAPVPQVGTVDWTGHVLLSQTDAFMHTAPTEGVLWPLEQAGVIVEIPEGVRAVEVAVKWDGPGEFGIHLHSHNNDGEYVGHRSTREQWSENPHCIRVPAADVAPGHWMVMIHSRDAVQTDFTMTVLTEGVTPKLVEDERHGHDRAAEIMAGKSLDDHDSEGCVLWAPAEDHEHAAG